MIKIYILKQQALGINFNGKLAVLSTLSPGYTAAEFLIHHLHPVTNT